MTKATATAWLQRYLTSIQQNDFQSFQRLFDPDVEYQSSPFSKPKRDTELRQSWDDLQQDRSELKAEGEVWCAKNDLVIAHWRGQCQFTGKGKYNGDGLLFLHFNEDGRCKNVRQWQHWTPAGSPPTRGFVDNPTWMKV